VDQLILSELKREGKHFYFLENKLIEISSDILASGKLSRLSGVLSLITNSFDDSERQYGWKLNLKCKRVNRIF
jgi:hypothetical protein